MMKLLTLCVLASTTAVGLARPLRNTGHIQTTLANVHAEELSKNEIEFFETTWTKVYHQIFGDGGDPSDPAAPGPQVNSFVVDVSKREPQKNKGLRSLQVSYGYWFDFFAFFDSACRLCAPDDDRRLLSKDADEQDNAEAHRTFELALLKSLRDSPYQAFKDLEDVTILYSEE